MPVKGDDHDTLANQRIDHVAVGSGIGGSAADRRSRCRLSLTFPPVVDGATKTSKCFASGFVDTVARSTQVPVTRSFAEVHLASEAMFGYPFAILTGEGNFSLSDAEASNLRTYLGRGGFLLASAGCSDDRWASSFRAAMAAVYPDLRLRALDMTHPVFHTLYDIDELAGKKKTVRESLYGLELNGRLAVVFSPHGLNDTANAGEGCCCCGGNELRDAHLINANILVYALTH
jgi:hypothetical protein